MLDATMQRTSGYSGHVVNTTLQLSLYFLVCVGCEINPLLSAVGFDVLVYAGYINCSAHQH